MLYYGAPSADARTADTGSEAEAALAKPDWTRRWAMIRALLGFSAALIAWITLFGADDGVREAALLGAFGLAGAVALGYLGFATQDDRNWLRRLGAAAQEPRR